jgi:hypothetical protein
MRRQPLQFVLVHDHCDSFRQIALHVLEIRVGRRSGQMFQGHYLVVRAPFVMFSMLFVNVSRTQQNALFKRWFWSFSAKVEESN